jgi:hypothetical protein
MRTGRPIVTGSTPTVALLLALVLLIPGAAAAQTASGSFRLGAIGAYVTSSELDTTEVGLGMLLAWNATPLVGIEAEIVIHPADMGPDPSFSSGRVETLFGLSVGPQLTRVRPFAKTRLGIIRFWESPEPLACIAIFPPPVRCTLANGRTAVGADIGGGLEVLPPGRAFVRFEAGDRVLSFPGPVMDSDGTAHEGGFFAHDLRISVGAGLRF